MISEGPLKTFHLKIDEDYFLFLLLELLGGDFVTLAQLTYVDSLHLNPKYLYLKTT